MAGPAGRRIGGTIRSGQAVAWLDPREDEVWRSMLRVHDRLMMRLDDDLRRGHALALDEYAVLVALSEHGPLRMAQLADRVRLSPSGLTRRVDRLVGRGLVTRLACPSDGRGSLAALTATGAGLLTAAAPTHVQGVRRYLLAALDREGLERLASGLDAVDRALDREGAEAVGGPPDQAGAPAGGSPRSTG